ncbi:unnamed protein product [Clonostachys rhizophaga]|uniref:CFEM domain-containing protein n=1 Tax=Clonostachys rhizophaga TaxID=160324 RepID=A0A9N9YYD9_9HYPO|nr:unnamed protein product [Clonostachys rhizophaga]
MSSSLITTLPTCALKCFISAINNSTCSLTDTACACGNAALAQQATVCIRSGVCTIREQLAAKNITSASCGIEPATTYAYIPITLTFIALAAVTGGVRLLSRLAFGLKLWWDDWMSFTALAACIGYTATMVACKSRGFGMDIWAVSFDEIPFLLRVNYVMNVLYVFTRMLIRISIVLFYMRIFQFDSAKRVMRIAMAVAIIVSMPAIFGSMFLCTPISYYWMRWDGGAEGHCVDSRSYIWSIWLILIVSDLFIMGAPLPFVVRLQLSWRRKLLISIMFCTGLVVVAITGYKLKHIEEFIGKTNPTYDVVPMAVWAAVELDLGVICACMPSMPVLFYGMRERVKGTKRSSLVTPKYPGSGSASRYAMISGNKSSDKGLQSLSSLNGQQPHFEPENGQIALVTVVQQARETYVKEDDIPLDDRSTDFVRPRRTNFESRAWS